MVRMPHSFYGIKRSGFGLEADPYRAKYLPRDRVAMIGLEERRTSRVPSQETLDGVKIHLDNINRRLLRGKNGEASYARAYVQMQKELLKLDKQFGMYGLEFHVDQPIGRSPPHIYFTYVPLRKRKRLR